MIHNKFLPTPMIPPSLVSSVTGVICQSDIVFSTTVSKIIVIPNLLLDSAIPVCSTLYLQKYCIFYSNLRFEIPSRMTWN